MEVIAKSFISKTLYYMVNSKETVDSTFQKFNEFYETNKKLAECNIAFSIIISKIIRVEYQSNLNVTLFIKFYF